MYRRATEARRRCGFTLIEVVVAMVVFSIGFMGILGLTLWFVRADVFNARMTEALAIAQSRMEKLLASSPDDLSDGTTTTGEFSCVWSVATPFTNLDLHALSVQVSWQDGREQSHQIELDSMLSEP